jgi:2,3-bisphosphoglycerate-independent phosphoglycerate mutase
MKIQKTVLIITDGIGCKPDSTCNAFKDAVKPTYDKLLTDVPKTLIATHGLSVGLPEGQMGNSEVGHLTIGCGTILRQDLVRIDDAIADGSFEQNAVLRNAMLQAKENNRPVHLLGLVSNGGVHSHVNHLCALINMCKVEGVVPAMHVITDGRDTSPKSAIRFIKQLRETLKIAGGGIATMIGRFYAMDRDTRWDRTKLAWELMVHGEGTPMTSSIDAIEECYMKGITDEFIPPFIMQDAEIIEPNDSLIFFNFRNDRPRQLAEALGMDDFRGFNRKNFEPITVTCITEYDKKLLAPVAFTPERPGTNVSHTICLSGFKQLHCAETEKYAHVTFFFNGGRETPYAGEDRIMIDSPKVNTYDEAPEMNAKKVADTIIEAVNKQVHSFIVVNFANGDMVGHSAVPHAIIKAVETLDTEVGRVLDEAVKNDYSVILTADHGNCDEYIDPFTGEPSTQHTVYPVPCLIIDKDFWRLRTNGGLSSLAPTILELMGLPQPDAMEGKSILLDVMSRDY